MAQARPSGAAARVAGRRRRLRHRVRCADRASRTSYRGRPVAAGKIPGVSETRESEQESPPSTPALARLRPMSCGARGRRGRTTAMQRGAGACAPQTCPVQREVAGGAPQLCSAERASAYHICAARGVRLRTTDMEPMCSSLCSSFADLGRADDGPVAPARLSGHDGLDATAIHGKRPRDALQGRVDGSRRGRGR